MKFGYVVLYVNDAKACRDFWIQKVGMIEKSRKTAGEFQITQVGFADDQFSFELVPLALMAANPDKLDLATPSIGFRVNDLAAKRLELINSGLEVSEITNHSEIESFAFSDNEGRWFAVLQS